MYRPDVVGDKVAKLVYAVPLRLNKAACFKFKRPSVPHDIPLQYPGAHR